MEIKAKIIESVVSKPQKGTHAHIKLLPVKSVDYMANLYHF